jgi:hypothetical protein
VSYAVKHVPDATKRFGVEKPEQLGNRAIALRSTVEAEQATAPQQAGRAVA